MRKYVCLVRGWEKAAGLEDVGTACADACIAMELMLLVCVHFCISRDSKSLRYCPPTLISQRCHHLQEHNRLIVFAGPGSVSGLVMCIPSGLPAQARVAGFSLAF